MAHDHVHVDDSMSDSRLVFSLLLNLLLTIFEAIAGIFAGSLALVADAVHNLSDCGTFVIALVASRIGRRPSDERRTFGYRRAEIIGALINLTVLVITSLYLVYEAIERFFGQPEINGWIVVAAAAVALVVNLLTVALLHAMSRGNMNVRAAYIHNLGDSLSSFGVILAGVAILLFRVMWVDSLMTLLVSVVILWQSFPDMRRSIHILMEGAPSDVDAEELIAELQAIAGVEEIHHLHLWELDEHHRALEAHVVVEAGDLERWAEIKQEIKLRLCERFDIQHSTLELESRNEASCEPCPPANRQRC
ncbi:MAG TPA: cation diffusion facilitator family transporter [Lacipirellulaceae bacterium]|jgi:cobalt-zinc-cadmium efflux system protein|nr:cation diffusion facilitator family transporter [Lacipirellulaceae bacterium]